MRPAVPNPFLPRPPASAGSGRFLWPALAAVALAGAGVAWWHAAPSGPRLAPPGTPFEFVPFSDRVLPLEPFAEYVVASVPPVVVPLPEPLDLGAAFGMADGAFSMPLPLPPPAPPPVPLASARPRYFSPPPPEEIARSHFRRREPDARAERCRALTAAAALDGHDAAAMARLAEACSGAR